MAEPVSLEELFADLKRRAAKLPPGSDVARFITEGAQAITQRFAQEIAEARQTASQEAAFSPSGVSPLQPGGDAAGGEAAPKDDPSSRR